MVDKMKHESIQQIQAQLTQLAAELPVLTEENHPASRLWSTILQGFGDLSQDVTHQEQRAKSSHRFLKTIIEHIPDPIFIKDKNHTLIEMNQANAAVLGQPQEELIGKTDKDLFPAELAEQFRQRDQAVFATNKALTVEDKTVWADGREHIAYTRLVPIPGPAGNEPEFLLGITHDVTGRKVQEKKRERLLTETTALYKGNQAITKAVSENQIFEAFFDQIRAYDPCEISAFRFNLVDGEPVWAELRATWQKSGSPTHPEGTRFFLPENSQARLLTTETPVFIDDIGTSPQLSDQERANLSASNVYSVAFLPLTTGGEAIGVVAVYFTGPYTFTRPIQRLWLALLDQASVSLANRRFIQKAAYRTTQMETAIEVAQAASSVLDLQELLNSSVDLIRNRFNLYYAGVFLVDEAKQWAVLRAGTGEAGRVQLQKEHRLKIGGGSMIGWAIEHRQARIALDVGKDAVHFQNPDLPQTRSEIALPLIYHNRVIGALTIQSVEQAAFSREDIIFLQIMANQLAIAIENARLFEQAQQEIAERKRTNEELAAINRVTTAVTLVLDLTEMLKAVAREMVETFQAQRCGIALLNADKTELEVIASYSVQVGEPGTEGMIIPVADNPSSRQVIETGKPVVVSQAQSSPLTKSAPEIADSLKTESIMTVPLLTRGEVIGTIGLNLDQSDREFTPVQVSLAETIAAQIANAIDNARLFEQTQKALEQHRREEKTRASSYRISEAAHSSQSLQELFLAVHDIISDLTRADNFYIALYDEKTDTLSFPYAIDKYDDLARKRPGQGITAYVLKTGEPLLATPEVYEDLVARGEIVRQGATAIDWLGVPLKTADKTIGVLAVQTYTEDVRLTERDKEILIFVSAQVAMAIERKQAEEALQTSEAKYRELVENANSIIFRMDTKGRVTFFNEFAQKFFGYTEAEILGRSVIGTIVPQTETTGRDSAKLLTSIIDHPDRYAANENENIRKNGDRVWVAWANKGIVDEYGNLIEVLCVGNDVTERKQAELALRNSETLYSSLVESLPQFIFRKDLAGRFRFANQRYCDQLRLPLKEIVGKTDFDLYPAEQAEEYQRDDHLVIQTKQILDKVEARPTPAGEERYIRVVKTPSYDADGRIIGIQGISWDITERKQAEKAVAQSVSLLEATLESTADGILVVDGEGGIIRFNQKFVDMWHIPDEVIASQDDDQALGYVLEQLKDPDQFVAKVQDLYKKPEETSYDMLHFKDGRVFERYSQPQFVEGKVQGRVWSFRDITEQKRAEEALVEERNLLRTLIDTLPADYIFVKDKESRFLINNLAHINILGGLNQEDIVGQTDFDIFPEELAMQYYTDEQKVMNSGQPMINQEEATITAEGTRQWLLSSKVPLRDSSGEIVGLVGVSHDITSRKKIEESLQAALRRSQSLYNISEAIATLTDQQAALETVLEEYLLLLGVSRGTVTLFDRTTGYNEVQALYIDNKVAQPSSAFRAEEDKLGQYLSENPFPLVIENVHTHPMTRHRKKILKSVRSMLLLPLMVKGEVVGLLSAEATEKEHTFTPDNIEVGKIISDQLAIWLENRGLLDTAQYRATLLQTGAEVSGAASSILDVNQLIETSVNLIRDKFDFYYVGLFLTDDAGKWAVLQAGTGKAGRRQIKKGHRLEVGGESMIGWAIQHRQARIALDVGAEKVHFQNPDLPDTRSEMALPLIGRDIVIGAVTIQSVEPSAFSDEDITALQTMADQLANAIVNARLFENVSRSQKTAEVLLQETQALQQFSQALAGTLSRNTILELFFQACTGELGFEYVLFSLVNKDQHRIRTIAGVGVAESHIRKSSHPLDSKDIMADIIQTGRTEIITGWDERFDKEIFESEGHATWIRLFTPITLRQENIGLVEAGFNRNTERQIEDSHIRSLRAFIDQTALALDNAERYEASLKVARREALIKEITTKVRASTDLDNILQTTVKEIGNAIGGKRTYIHLVSPTNGETTNDEAKKANEQFEKEEKS